MRSRWTNRRGNWRWCSRPRAKSGDKQSGGNEVKTKPIANSIFLAVAFAPAVFAQEQGAEGLEEVIVTARKVEENLQSTPISITALSGPALEERQVFSTDVLDQVVPNLQFANNAPLAGNNSSSQ